MERYKKGQQRLTKSSRRRKLTHRCPRAAGCRCLVSSADKSHPSRLFDLHSSNKLLSRVKEIELLALGGVRARVGDNVNEGELLAEQGGKGCAC